MKLLNQELEASVKILAYSDSEEELVYKTIETIPNVDNKISFNALIEVKQTAPIEGKHIEVSLVHILDGGIADEAAPRGKSRQHVSRLLLGEIKLFDLDNIQGSQASRPKLTLIRDPWDTKQLIKWSFEGAPIRGTGIYAITLDVFLDDDKRQRKLLDCDYIEVI